VRLLIPEQRETSPEQLAAGLRLADRAPEDRPYLALNMVSTADGKATMDWRTRGISTDVDRELFHHLRTQADAVMVGAGTVRAERYGVVTKTPELRAKRVEEGVREVPLAVIVSGRLDLPWDAPLFTCGGGEVLILTTTDADPPETATPVRVSRHESMVDLSDALREMRADGIRSVLCEGGPHLHAQLIQGGLIDELFVTRAPKLAGGQGPGLIAGLPEADRPLQLAWLAVERDTGELFARYQTTGGP
jgi:riboflavin-specific deaminase-like protein